MEINSSGSTILYLQLKLIVFRKKSVWNHFGYYGMCPFFPERQGITQLCDGAVLGCPVPMGKRLSRSPWPPVSIAFPTLSFWASSLVDSLCSSRWFPKGWFWRMFPRNENRNGGTFGCSPPTKTGTRVRSHIPPERIQERGHIRQNPPFTKPPLCLPVILQAQMPLKH